MSLLSIWRGLARSFRFDAVRTWMMLQNLCASEAFDTFLLEILAYAISWPIDVTVFQVGKVCGLLRNRLWTRWHTDLQAHFFISCDEHMQHFASSRALRTIDICDPQSINDWVSSDQHLNSGEARLHKVSFAFELNINECEFNFKGTSTVQHWNTIYSIAYLLIYSAPYSYFCLSYEFIYFYYTKKLDEKEIWKGLNLCDVEF